jgi:hypothetical protein
VSNNDKPFQTFFSQTTMTNNPYVQQLMQKGYTEAELRKPVARPEVPANMRDIYKTYDEYREALHDFLNGL